MEPYRLPYDPQPKQRLLHECQANEILFGGAAGGGKSASLRMEAFMWAMRIPGIQIFLFRRTLPELEHNHVIPSLEFFPRDAGTYKTQKKRWEFNNGSMLHFCSCQYENDVFNFQGAELHLLLLDELTSFTEWIYDYLRGRVRCTLNIPPQYRHKIPGIICSSNPGGIGHEFAKRRWVDFAPPFELKRAPKNEGGMVRCYLPAKIEDNPILLERDPEYVHRLDALPEPYRTAYREGDWDIFMGQAFAFNKRDHVIKPMPIPEHAPLYMTFDWGFGAPFSIGWWWVDADGRVYRFSEWYGASPGQPNVGLKLTDSQIAEGVIMREKQLGIWGKPIQRLCDPTCFNKKPNYMGGGQGPATSTVFASHNLILSPGDPSRKLKIRQFHERLRVPKDGTAPMMLIYENCVDFIRTIPLLVADPKNPEDINSKGEDHCYDDACHIAMAWPLSMEIPPAQMTAAERDYAFVEGRIEDLDDEDDDEDLY